MSLPKISLVTPSFNQGAYIEQTICSVLDQQYPDLEYMIIDGGSSDESVDIIRKYAKYLKYWVSEPDEGQSHAINKGISRCTGDVFNWINTDDYYEPQALWQVGQCFEDPRIEVLAGRSRSFDAQGSSVINAPSALYNNNLAKTIGWARIDQPATFFRRSVVEQLGNLDTRLHYLMDRDWWIRYLLQNGTQNIQVVDDLLVHFRLHERSKTVAQSSKFLAESNTYFSGLAQHYGVQEIQYFFEKMGIMPLQPMSVLPTVPQHLVKKALHYYLLLIGLDGYVQFDKSQTALFLNAVDPDLLVDEDRNLWQKVLWRNRWLPNWLIKLGRRS